MKTTLTSQALTQTLTVAHAQELINDFTQRFVDGGPSDEEKRMRQHHLLTIITDNVPPGMVGRLVHPNRVEAITRRLKERLLAVDCE